MSIVIFLSSLAHAAVPVVATDRIDLDVNGFAHMFVMGQFVDDPARDDARAFLFLDQARHGLSGRLDRSTLNVQVAFGGETDAGPSLGLLDFAVATPLGMGETVQVKAGQFRVPYGREQLADDAGLAFGGRSLGQLAFVVGRDVGVAVVARPGPVTVIGGVFTGGGRGVPVRYIPEELGIPLLVVRAGVGDAAQDPFALATGSRDVDALEGAVYLNALYTRDSAVGHSTLLSVKSADKSVLLDETWNPYVGDPTKLGDWWQAGADAVVRAPAGPWTLAVELQGDVAGFESDAGSVLAIGGRAQVAASRGPVEVAARWACLVPDKAFPTDGDAPIHEITPAVGVDLAARHVRILLDLPIVVGAPVYIEDGVGAYVGTDLPGQADLLAEGGTVERQTVAAARLALQGQF